ncbi:hypothetical protein [Streptomyces sp. NPDC006285]|uniref:hypothetical protein n=1 Tax=Streptomyces sp. NPDC006285 TaxID=3364742 RepID=UPI0036B13A33
MPHLLTLGAAPNLPLLLAVGVPGTLALVLTAWAARRRSIRPRKRPTSSAVKVAALAALGCTAYSADTSWRFAADYLNMAGTAERIGMFAAAELALFATALMARQNLTVQGAPGLPGTLVWVITGVQIIPAYAESGLVGGTVRAFVGPVMAAMLWHQALGIELRLRTPGAVSHGLLAILGREARERLLSRLGIATRDRDAAQITRDRATTRAVALAARLAERTPEQRHNWRGRRLSRRLSKAVGRASVGTDPVQRAQLLDQLAARRHALALATVPLPSPWSPTHGTATAVTVPSPKASEAPSLKAGSHSPGNLTGDPGPREPRGPVPEIEGATTPEGVAADGDGTVSGAGTSDTGTAEHPGDAGTSPATREAPPQSLEPHRGPGTGTGTEPTGDRGPGTGTGTEPTGDRGPGTGTGTEPTGDRGREDALWQGTTSKVRTESGRKNGDRPSIPQMQRPPREPEQSVDQLIQRVRPHVPAVLERDGNESITRVQLREILRKEGLKGGRNDRLSLVLQGLRSNATTTTRSTAR